MNASIAAVRRRFPPGVKRAYRGGVRRAAALTGPLRTLPDFLIIGAQKAGTTSLYDYLVEHPDVLPAAAKEVHYFDLRYAKGLNWYRGHFPPRAMKGDRLTGEASPYYLYHPLAPARTRELLPDAKLVVLLRDPVDRAYSQHNHETVLGNETLPFWEAIQAEESRLAGEEERILAEPGYMSYAHGHHAYLARGRYAPQIERWLAHFDRAQFLFLRAEDLFQDPAAVYARTLEFLGLPPYSGVRFTPRNARSYAPIPDDVRRELARLIAPANRELRDLLGEEFTWDEPPPG
jgi:hypothetical protein